MYVFHIFYILIAGSFSTSIADRTGTTTSPLTGITFKTVISASLCTFKQTLNPCLIVSSYIFTGMSHKFQKFNLDLIPTLGAEYDTGIYRH